MTATRTCPLCTFPTARVVAETDHFYARPHDFPATAGHVEIIPKHHVESFFDLTPADLEELHSLMHRVRAKIEEDHRPLAYTIGVNDGAAAGRTIDHLHIHLIPRYLGDVPNPRGGIRQIFPDQTTFLG